MEVTKARLHLLGELTLWHGSRLVALPRGPARLAAFLALHERPVPRTYAAGVLWPDGTDERAAAALRSALWRLAQACPNLVRANGPDLSLDTGLDLDLREIRTLAVMARADRLLEAADVFRLIDAEGLLPGWPEGWLCDDRERLHHLRIETLERLCVTLTAQGRHGLAAAAGMAAIAAEPLRDSAHRAVVRLHLAQGNKFEAVRHQRLWRRSSDVTVTGQ